MIEIPLNISPEQTFNIILGEETYDMRVVLNSRLEQWSISVSQNGVSIIEGVALVGGIDIFNQYNIPLSNAYVVNINNGRLDPTRLNLGFAAKLMLLTDEELSNG